MQQVEEALHSPICPELCGFRGVRAAPGRLRWISPHLRRSGVKGSRHSPCQPMTPSPAIDRLKRADQAIPLRFLLTVCGVGGAAPPLMR